jgi:radical SAM-linked protein
MMDRFEPERVSISLSSMHASTITPELAREVRRVRKSGFTIAPEAGTQRMRDVINKNLTEEQILTACRLAFEAGWDHIKLYFMIGLPSETDADVDGLVDLAHAIRDVGRRARNGRRGRTGGKEVTLSASSFVPKAETPFQWLGMDRIENLRRKQDRIAARVRRGVQFKHHDCGTSFLEAAFSRGDRSLGRVLERAWRAGARFDGWDEHFRGDVWRGAFEAERIDPGLYAYTDFDPRARLPWDVIDSRVNRKWLALELRRAMSAATLSVCGPTDCHGCAPFARDCVTGVVRETTDRPLKASLPVLATPAAPGPGLPACAPQAPPLVRADIGGTPPVEDTRPRYRYRARFTKTGRMRFLGHLDLYRLLMRGLRRAGVSLVYSQGFNPKPRLACGPALPVGVSSEAEYVDFETRAPLDVDLGCERINGALPAGVRFLALVEVPRDLPALGEAVRAACYRVRGPHALDLPGAVREFGRRPPGTVERRREDGKVATFELERELLALEAIDGNAMRLTVAMRQSGASMRADEVVVAVVGQDHAAACDVVREGLLVDWGGTLVDPLLAAMAARPSSPAP